MSTLVSPSQPTEILALPPLPIVKPPLCRFTWAKRVIMHSSRIHNISNKSIKSLLMREQFWTHGRIDGHFIQHPSYSTLGSTSSIYASDQGVYTAQLLIFTPSVGNPRSHIFEHQGNATLSSSWLSQPQHRKTPTDPPRTIFSRDILSLSAFQPSSAECAHSM